MKYFDFEIELLHVAPPRVFRSFMLATKLIKGTTLRDLHAAIQAVTGWTDSHLFHFETEDGEEVGQCGIEDSGEKSPRVETVALTDAFTDARDHTLIYNYDYGDGWCVRVTNHGIVERDKSTVRFLTGGFGGWPPDDSGGPPMFDTLRVTFAKRESKMRLSEDEKDLLDWAGDWTPEFNVEQTLARFNTRPLPRTAKKR